MGLLRHYNRWHKGEQRKEDKHEYVDLGLPSGILWAKCNLGADTEVDYGGYYAWGETEEKNEYIMSTYKFFDDVDGWRITKYNRKDGLTTLEPEDDAIYVNWGGKWRMPTNAECEELIKYTVSKWVNNYNDTGINGRLFTSKKNKNTLFFPASGQKDGNEIYELERGLYINSLDAFDTQNLYQIYCDMFRCEFGHYSKYFGSSVRGVREK